MARSYHCRSRKCGGSDAAEGLSDFELAKKYPAGERYSWGVYAGMLCNSCWADDGRNHDNDETSFDPDYCGESMEADE
jgi:hypothetical protein